MRKPSRESQDARLTAKGVARELRIGLLTREAALARDPEGHLTCEDGSPESRKGRLTSEETQRGILLRRLTRGDTGRRAFVDARSREASFPEESGRSPHE